MMATGVVSAVGVVAGGTNYAVGDKIVIKAGDLNCVLLVATLGGSNAVATVTIFQGGSGYSAAAGIATLTNSAAGAGCTITVGTVDTLSQNLATTVYTLKFVKANIKSKLGNLSNQKLDIFEKQINNLLHGEILKLRALMGKSLDAFYMTKTTLGTITLTSGFGSTSITAQSIADVNRITLYDPTLKQIPIYDTETFNSIRSTKTTTEMGTTEAIATVLSISAVANTAPYVLSMGFYTGASSSLTTVEMYYPRNPIQVTTDIDTLDVPDNYIPIVENMTAITMFTRLKKTPPTELTNELAAFMNTQLSSYGLKATPQG
jgi:hypothetical protein